MSNTGADFDLAGIQAYNDDDPRLAAGAEVRGPALVQEPFTVLVLPAAATARLDDHGNNYDVTL